MGQRVSRGVDAVGDEGLDHTGPNVVIECVPLPLKQRARHFRDGARGDGDRGSPHLANMLSPRAKIA